MDDADFRALRHRTSPARRPQRHGAFDLPVFRAALLRARDPGSLRLCLWGQRVVRGRPGRSHGRAYGRCPFAFGGGDFVGGAERDWIRSAVRDYGIAILAVTVAFLVRWALWPLLGTAIPFLIHWPAIIVAAWYGGFRAGFLATLLSAIGTAFFLLQPRYSLAITRPAEQFGTVFFLFLGTGLSFLLEKVMQGETHSDRSRGRGSSVSSCQRLPPQLLEASPDPLVAIGPDGKITDVNAATEAATGKARAELIGTDFDDYFAEPERAQAGYKQVFREGSVRDYPLEIRHLDGHLTPVLYNASVYRDEAGKVMGVFAAARDISERVKG